MTTAVEKQSDDENYTETVVKLHPLQDTWTYYFFLYRSNKEWEDNITKVANFGTVEHFWSVLKHTDPPSRTPNGTDILLFRSDIQPKWEDPKNENGGRWLINIVQPTTGDTYWEELLMLLVGCCWDTDEQAEQVCGAVYQPRARGHKMAVWLSNYEDEENVMQIGQQIKDRLNYPHKMYFQTVDDQKHTTRGKDINTGRYVL